MPCRRSRFFREENFERASNYFLTRKQRDVFTKKAPAQANRYPEVEYNFYQGLSFAQLLDLFEYVQFNYSAGIPIEQVVKETREMLDAFVIHFEDNFTDTFFALWEKDSYYSLLSLLSLSLLSDREDLFEYIPYWINDPSSGNNDLVVDKPLKAIFDLIGFKEKLVVSNEDFFPDSVYRLLPALVNTKDQREKQVLLKTYLDNWYQSHADAYWYESHRDNELFFGYWCFESAMLALLLDIDITGFGIADSEYFPLDYFNWAKSQREKLAK